MTTFPAGLGAGPLTRVRLALLFLSPALFLVGAAVAVSLVALSGLDPQTIGGADAGLARIGSDLALVIVTSTGLPVAELRELIANWGLVVPAFGLVGASLLAWRLSGRVLHVVDTAHRAVVTADRERESRLAEIVHELRTPLAVMETNLELAAAGAGNGYVDAARRAVGRMARTVDDLAGHGRLAIDVDGFPVDLGGLAEVAVAEHVGPGQARGVHVRLAGVDQVLVPAVDPVAVAAVIGNFMSNAARLAPTGSVITVDWGEHDGWGWLSVSDEGPGLPAHHHARAFERGWQGPHDRDRKGLDTGSGLGLTIARQLTEAQGGAVTVVSEEGGGATFALWLRLGKGADRGAVVAPDGIHPAVTPWGPALLHLPS